MARRLTHQRYRTTSGGARHDITPPAFTRLALLNLVSGSFTLGLLGGYLLAALALTTRRQHYQARMRQPSLPHAYASWLLRQHG